MKCYSKQQQKQQQQKKSVRVNKSIIYCAGAGAVLCFVYLLRNTSEHTFDLNQMGLNYGGVVIVVVVVEFIQIRAEQKRITKQCSFL